MKNCCRIIFNFWKYTHTHFWKYTHTHMSYILVWYDLLKRQRLTSTWLFRWESNSWASLSWLLTWFTSDGCKNVTTRMKASKTYEKGKNCNLQCEGGQKVGQFAWIDSTYFVPSIVVDLFASLITNCHWFNSSIYTSPHPEISSTHPIPIQPSMYSTTTSIVIDLLLILAIRSRRHSKLFSLSS